MTGLLAGRLKDPAGLDAVRADLASVVQWVLEPARVWLRISHCDWDWLNPDRRWRGRSQTDRGFGRQPTQGPDVFAVGRWHRDPPHPLQSLNDLERTTLAGRARFGRRALHPPGPENLACARGIRQTMASGS